LLLKKAQRDAAANVVTGDRRFDRKRRFHRPRDDQCRAFDLARTLARRVAIVFRDTPGLVTSTRRRCRSGDASASTAVIPAALAATVAIRRQLREWFSRLG
jgi:hypothetical protein